MARQHWSRRIEFFLTTVGFAVGVGDLWRFPYLVMKNGGGAFLIPILVFNLIGAIPIVYLEMLMGQYSQSGTISVWSVCPLFKGVGYGTVIVNFLYSVYYAVMICWMLYYFINSFFFPLRWNSCDNAWNIPETCVVSQAEIVHAGATANVTNVSDVTTTIANSVTAVTTLNGTLKLETAAEQFWFHETLKISPGLHELGGVNWPLLGCLAVIQLVCFLCVFKGIKFSGKVVYVTVLVPFLMLFIFLIRGVILPGAKTGILYYLTPDVSKLAQPKIWAEACMQVVRSIGPGVGVMITFASFNKFSHDCTRDAVLVCLMDLFAGFLGGFVIFTLIGHLSYQTGIDISNFNKAGLGLGFIAYPEAANYLPPAPQLWCALFFAMSVFLGIDSEFPGFEIVVTALTDEFPKLFAGRKRLLVIGVIISAFLLAVPQVTHGGVYVLTLVDWYVGTFSATVFALIEVIVMVYIYGMDRLEDNAREMTGRGIPLFFKVCLYAVTPILLVVVLGATIYTYRPPSFWRYTYPPWAVGLGWMIAICSLVPLPIYAGYKLYTTEGTLLERIKKTTTPSEDWGRRPDDKLDPVTNGYHEEVHDNKAAIFDTKDTSTHL